MTTPTTHARIHRFGDYVAIYIGDGETKYLSATMAEKLAAALSEYADEVRHVTFTNSQVGTTTLEDSV